MKMLITGASGFVGGALWRAAGLAGWEVLALGRRPLAASGYRSVDLSGAWDLDFRPDVVVHAAARSSPWGSRREFVAQNVTATRRLLEFCERQGRPFFIQVSTSAVLYRNEHQLGMTEESALPPRSINLYAETKREAEQLVAGYAGPSCIVRPRAVFGPGDTVVFPRILRAARAGRLPRIESRQPVLADLIYIDTLVDYLLRIAAQRAQGLYILTNNQPMEIWALLERILGELKLPLPQRRVPVERAQRIAALIEGLYAWLPFLGEPPLTRFGVSVFAYSKTFNIAKALRDLGPPSCSLEEGLQRFVAWQSRELLSP